MKGLYAEKLFEVEALKRGFNLSKPVNPTSRYDYLIDLGYRILRVQIKSTIRYAENNKKKTFNIKLHWVGEGKKVKKYTKEEVDIFAVYIEPLNMWYIIPQEKIGDTKHITLRPDGNSIYNVYDDAWYLIE
jgi:hypothetical protein